MATSFQIEKYSSRIIAGILETRTTSSLILNITTGSRLVRTALSSNVSATRFKMIKMQLSQRTLGVGKSFWIGTLVCVALAGCGGGGGGSSPVPRPTPTAAPTPPAAPTPTAAPTPQALAVTPGSVSLNFVGATGTFVATEQLYSGVFSVDGSNCSNIASLTPSAPPGPSATFTLTELAPGTCTLSLSDAYGQKQSVTVTTTTTSGGIQ